MTSREKMIWVLQLLLAKVKRVNRAADKTESVEDSGNFEEDNEDGEYESSFINNSESDDDMDGPSGEDEHRSPSQELQ